MKWNKKFHYPESIKSLKKTFESNIPSVSLILKETMPEEKKLALRNWMEKVGIKEAEKIKIDASKRGALMHNYIEKFLENKLSKPKDDTDKAYKMAKVIIKNGLEGNLEEIWKTEAILCFPGRFLGITDLVGVVNSKPSIIDYKQSNSPKQEKYCEDYFLQLAAYVLAHDKVYNTKIEQGIIFLATESFMFQRFVLEGERLEKYKELFLERVNKFNSKKL